MKDRFNRVFRLLDAIQTHGKPLTPGDDRFEALRIEFERVQQELVAGGIEA